MRARRYNLLIATILLAWIGISTANRNTDTLLIHHGRHNKCPLDTKIGETGTLASVNSTRICEWRMKTLDILERGGILFNTKNMDCNGGSVNFNTDFRNRSLTKNFCNQPNCLVFVRRKSPCDDNDMVNKTIQKLFEKCRDFEWYIKPHPLRIIASNDARNFELSYSLFNCSKETASTTVSTTTMESTTQMEIQTTTTEEMPTTAPPGAIDEATTDIAMESTTTITTEATPTTVGVDFATESPTPMTTKIDAPSTKVQNDDKANKHEIEIIFKTACKEYKEVRVGESATLEVTNKTKHCGWGMRQLDHLKREGVIYKTEGMYCEGGGVIFPVPVPQVAKPRRKNFCNHTKCLVYVKRNSSCDNQASLNETIKDMFDDCTEYEWYVKPKPFEIQAPEKTTAFTISYTVFNCTKEERTTAPSTEQPITREPKETRAVTAANSGSGNNYSRIQAWWIIVPLLLLVLIAIALSIAYLCLRKKKTAKKSMARRIDGKDEHISTIAL